MLTLLPRAPEAAAAPPVLLSVHRAGVLAGAAVCMPPYDLVVSGLPGECAGAAVDAVEIAFTRSPERGLAWRT